MMGSSPCVVENLGPVFQLYSDGTIVRKNKLNITVSLLTDESIIFKDLIYERKYNLHVRLYKHSSKMSSASCKLPIAVFLRGGGFCVGSRTWPSSHNCCLRLASGLKALVISADYRLAPEHRLPAAIEDAFSLMKWLQGQALGSGDGWLDPYEVDFERVFVVGDSSGANIAHHLAVKLKAGSTALAPVCVRAYVLLAPFFGGVLRTRSEEGPSEAVLSLEILDKFWRLSLPAGETRDHPIANPFGPMSPRLEAVNLDPILVVVGECELLRDRAKDYAKRLKAMKKRIEYVEFEGKEHGFFNKHPYSEVGGQFIQLLNNFIFHNFY